MREEDHRKLSAQHQVPRLGNPCQPPHSPYPEGSCRKPYLGQYHCLRTPPSGAALSSGSPRGSYMPGICRAHSTHPCRHRVSLARRMDNPPDYALFTVKAPFLRVPQNPEPVAITSLMGGHHPICCWSLPTAVACLMTTQDATKWGSREGSGPCMVHVGRTHTRFRCTNST